MAAPVVKPKGSLKAYLEAKKKPTRLIGAVEQHILTRPLDTSRATDVIHPSALIKDDFCVRESYFVITGKGIRIVPEERVGLRLQTIFDEGHNIHSKWQSWLTEMGVLYGRWKCAECGMVTKDLCTPQSVCGICGSMSMVYAEVPLRYPELMIAGHSDGWVKGLGDDFLIEIKSVGTGTVRTEQPSLLAQHGKDFDAIWRDIRRPFGSHMKQGQLYLELARKMYGDKAPKEIVFIYEAKPNQSYKEFVVTANSDFIQDALDKAELVAHAVRSSVAPPCNLDRKSGCRKCAEYEEVAA